MAVDLTPLEPVGMQIHVELNSGLSALGFFKTITPEQKEDWDRFVEAVLKEHGIPYED